MENEEEEAEEAEEIPMSMAARAVYLQSLPSHFGAEIISKQIKCIVTVSENSESISGMAGWSNIKIVINSMLKRTHKHTIKEKQHNTYTSTKCTTRIHHFLWQYAFRVASFDLIMRACRCVYFASSYYYDSIISFFVFNNFDVVGFLLYDVLRSMNKFLFSVSHCCVSGTVNM